MVMGMGYRPDHMAYSQRMKIIAGLGQRDTVSCSRNIYDVFSCIFYLSLPWVIPCINNQVIKQKVKEVAKALLL